MSERRPEEEVPDEDRGGVPVCRVGARGAAPHVRLVHDVVVVERGEVGQLHPGGGRDDPLVDPVAELGGEQREERPEPLPAGRREVRAGLGDERVVMVDAGGDEVVDGPEAHGEPGPEAL